MERARLRRRPAVHLPRGSLPPNNNDSSTEGEGVNGSGSGPGGGGGAVAVALRCGAEERITADNLVQGDWDEGRGWEVQMLPDSPMRLCTAANSNGGYWFAWDSGPLDGRGVGGGVAETVVPLDTVYIPDAPRKGLHLGKGRAASGEHLKDQRALLYDCIRGHIVTLRGCKTGSKVIWLFDRMRAYYGY
ncbi:hypothetical protein B0H16DRAFT_1884969 [Mycena metata]|uniref:Uncharacterized protein n=1 Tax=Mycena metata TaxID=1033252 RepID=A0AAD7NG87_9AGAR|nr:hypothetical protein B0H16DRAFT_1884969 [Mycena metata]